MATASGQDSPPKDTSPGLFGGGGFGMASFGAGFGMPASVSKLSRTVSSAIWSSPEDEGTNKRAKVDAPYKPPRGTEASELFERVRRSR